MVASGERHSQTALKKLPTCFQSSSAIRSWLPSYSEIRASDHRYSSCHASMLVRLEAGLYAHGHPACTAPTTAVKGAQDDAQSNTVECSRNRAFRRGMLAVGLRNYDQREIKAHRGRHGQGPKDRRHD